jgi:molybdate transport system regulatory protein
VRRVAKLSKQNPALLPRLRVVVGGDIALGPGKVELLEHIQAMGSIFRAAKRMKMSYMRAWTLLKTMEKCFKKNLVTKSRGGKSGGSAQLTETGQAVLALYRRMEKDCLRATRDNWREVRRHLKS